LVSHGRPEPRSAATASASVEPLSMTTDGSAPLGLR
jgi:hypothetical protein